MRVQVGRGTHPVWQATRGTRGTRGSPVGAVSVGAVLLCSALVGLSACAGSEVDPSTERRGSGTAFVRTSGTVRPLPTNGPPPEAPSDVSVWVNVPRVPVAGGDVVIAVRNHGATPVSYGVGGAIEWWDGSGWTDATPMLTCLETWPCIGKAEQPGATLVAVPGILLTAQAGAFGPIETVDVIGFDPGWYRFVKHVGPDFASAVYGGFEVAPDAARTAPVPGDRIHRLSVTPAVIGTGGARVRLHVVLNGGAGGSAEELARLEPSLSANAELQRWDGTQWVSSGTMALDRSGAEAGGLAVAEVTVPPLGPGDYRIVRRITGGREVPGALFVVG